MPNINISNNQNYPNVNTYQSLERLLKQLSENQQKI